MAQQQQTVLRVQTNKSTSEIIEYDFLDLNGDVPIKINKSFAELTDISKRNSDYSVGLTLPGSKKNNAFFENFFNVDTQSLYFNASKRIYCNVLINDEPYFTGYLRLNKVSVLESKIEYSVTLYSTIGDLFGNIGNNLLKDLNFGDSEYKFNHIFGMPTVTKAFSNSNYSIDSEYPLPYIYPIVHNGYEYTGNTVNLSGTTVENQTRLYTTTGPLGSYATPSAAWAAGVKQYRINSPTQGIMDNQLKPALNVWSLIQLMFKTYGYSITSDFMNTPWMKTLYLYGYFSSSSTKFSYTVYDIQELPLSGVEVVFIEKEGKIYSVVCKLGTGIPCYCSDNIDVQAIYNMGTGDFSIDGRIPYGTSGVTFNVNGLIYGTSSDVPVGTSLSYFPVPVNTSALYQEDDYVDFSLVIDPNIKQIDFLSSIAKKFNLVFVPDPDVKNRIKIESYDFYMGTGDVHDWTDKISWDKGFTVEPALNYIESELILTDQEDGDEGNREFKNRNVRVYGENKVYNPTDFKSQTKKIDTIFSPEIIRKWDADNTNNVGLPLGINYVASSQEFENGNQNTVSWFYKGVKTKPKLFFYLGGFNPFLDVLGENYDATNTYRTYEFVVTDTNAVNYAAYDTIPTISHTMPMGNKDSNKINNDSLCILFNSEQPLQNIGVTTYNAYTENDAYNVFYSNRITNLYDPNTRYLGGYFDLKLSDINNLKPNDLIKVNEQYFTWDKIDGYNLTSTELTKASLVQFNANTKQYPDRYFQYFYCDDPTVVYRFKTYFTESNLLDSNYGWSTYYDNQMGILSSGSTVTTGFTSTFRVVRNSKVLFIPYTMYEVSQQTYESTGFDWENDPVHQEVYANPTNLFGGYSMPSFWINSGSTRMGANVFPDCSTFYSTKTAFGILTGPSVPGPEFGPSGKYVLMNATDGIDFLGLWVSNDYGESFTFSGINSFFKGGAVNALGQIMYACAYPGGEYSYVYKSPDYGVNWYIMTGATTDGICQGIDCSSNGQYVTMTMNFGAFDAQGFRQSSDYGRTWSTFSGTTSVPYVSVDVNTYGAPQYFAGSTTTSGLDFLHKQTTIGGSITDFGNAAIYNSLMVSNDGQTMITSEKTTWASGSLYPVSMSFDAGNTWTGLQYNTTSSFGTARTLGMSSNGETIAVGAKNNVLYSNDNGTTFTTSSTIITNIGDAISNGIINVSRDGDYIFASQGGNSFGGSDFYVSSNGGSSFTEKIIGNLGISVFITSNK